MGSIEEVQEVINTLCSDSAIPKNVRAILDDVKKLIADDKKTLAVKVNTALQKMEELAMDPNLSASARTQIMNLSSLLEGLL